MFAGIGVHRADSSPPMTGPCCHPADHTSLVLVALGHRQAADLIKAALRSGPEQVRDYAVRELCALWANLGDSAHAQAARPALEASELVDALKDTLLVAPICSIDYTHEGTLRGFVTQAEGLWMDVEAVVDAFNAFMTQIGHPQRAFRLASDSDANGDLGLLRGGPTQASSHAPRLNCTSP